LQGLDKSASLLIQVVICLYGHWLYDNESERVVNHPVRRRIIMLLMLTGNAGVVTAVSSLILTVVHQGGTKIFPDDTLVCTAILPR